MEQESQNYVSNATLAKEVVLVNPLNDEEENLVSVKEDHADELGIEPHGMCGILLFRPYSNFVLFALTLTYGSNIFCRYLVSVTSREMQADQGWGNARGTGIEYDLLFGPIFVGVGSVSVLLLGLLADYRKWAIIVCLLGWCAVTFVTSLTTVYWQLLLLRVAVAVFTACTPLVLSLLVPYFPEDLRGTALSIYNFALYVGYSASLGIGAILTEDYGWRKTFQFAAFSGVPAFICLLFVREPKSDEIVVDKSWPPLIPFVDPNLNEIVQKFCHRIVLTDRSGWCCRLYRNCFLGREAVDVIMSLNVVISRIEAVEWGNVLFKRNYFRHVTGDYPLIDGNYLYRFRPKQKEENNSEGEDLRVDLLIDEQLVAYLRSHVACCSISSVDVESNSESNRGSGDSGGHGSTGGNRDGSNGGSGGSSDSSSGSSSSSGGPTVCGKDVADALCSYVSVSPELGIQLGDELLKLGYLESVSQTNFVPSITSYYQFVAPENVNQQRAEQLKRMKNLSHKHTFWMGLVYFAKNKILWALFIAGGLRWGAGFIWAQYTDIYYATQFPLADRANWLGWIPTAGGLLGVGAGGLIGDRAVVKHGIWARPAVISISCFFSIPFQLGALYCDAPLAFLMLLPMYMCSEMWIGLCLAAVLEVCPADLCTIGISVYLFIINNIGGLMNVCVQPLGNVLAVDENDKLKYALSILFPGMFLMSGVLFLGVAIALRRRTFTHYPKGQRLLAQSP